jgi:hypothetical protein
MGIIREGALTIHPAWILLCLMNFVSDSPLLEYLRYYEEKVQQSDTEDGYWFYDTLVGILNSQALK